MKQLISRIMFWFDNGEELTRLVERFSPWGEMLNRLIHEKYQGKKLEYVNLYFKTSKNYTNTINQIDDVFHRRTTLLYYGWFDIDVFNALSPSEQIAFVWNEGCRFLIRAAEVSGNKSLADSCRYAHAKGLEMGLNPDFKRLSVPVELYGKHLQASVWIRYNDAEEEMCAVFVLEDGDKVLMDKEFYVVDVKYTFFPSWVKKIEVKNGNTIIVKGHYELERFPIKIPISEELLQGK